VLRAKTGPTCTPATLLGPSGEPYTSAQPLFPLTSPLPWPTSNDRNSRSRSCLLGIAFSTLRALRKGSGVQGPLKAALLESDPKKLVAFFFFFFLSPSRPILSGDAPGGIHRKQRSRDCEGPVRVVVIVIPRCPSSRGPWSMATGSVELGSVCSLVTSGHEGYHLRRAECPVRSVASCGLDPFLSFPLLWAYTAVAELRVPGGCSR